MARYAEGTDVPVERSRAEIQHELERFGATAFGWMTDQAAAAEVILFKIGGRTYRVPVPVPDPDDPSLRKPVNSWSGQTTPDDKKIAQRRRELWRAVLLYVKSVVVAVQSGIMPAETALLPYALLPDGRTSVGEWAETDLVEAYREGRMPLPMPGMSNRLLPAPGGNGRG